MIGTLLSGRYHLEAVIGRGTTGHVYRAHDVLLDRDAAVKVLTGAGPDGGAREQLLEEARAAARLNHPNIVSVYDAGASDGILYIVMELVGGGSLQTRRPRTMAAIVSIACQICAALEYAHGQGLLHRDLKPENVLLTADGTAKLSDLGSGGSFTSRVDRDGRIVGTVFYLAPEQALGGALDGRVDLYALGVLLYELTTGQLPYSGDDPLAVIAQHLYSTCVPARARNAAVPPVLDALISRLLSKDPDQRPATAGEVLRLLQAPDILDPDALTERALSVLDRIERGRMVGRERELQQAVALWIDASSGQGRTLLISGEPGIGKSRLVQTLATQAQISGGRVLQGACYAQGGMPYAPFSQWLPGAVAEGTGDRHNLEESLPAGLPRPGQIPGALPAPGEPVDEERSRLFNGLARTLAALADETPLLLVIEDIHWADSSTLLMLLHLARSLRNRRALIVATAREVPTEEALPLQQLLLALQRERLATRLKLSPLSRERTGEMLSVLFAQPVAPELLDAVYAQTEGNPFFIEEVCRGLVESGRVTYEDGCWRQTGPEDQDVPPSISVAIQSRVGALSGMAQETLRMAAVLGRSYDLDTLLAASERSRDEVQDGLDEARRALLIDRVVPRAPAPVPWAPLSPAGLPGAGPGAAYAFSHTLVASAIEAELSSAERRRLHRRAATAIEAQHPGDWEALAYQYDRGGDAERAIGYLLQAGDRARALYALAESIAHYERALALLRAQDDRERTAETLLRLGLAYTASFQLENARAAYEQAFDLWEPLREAWEAAATLPAPRTLRLAIEEPLSLDPGRIYDDVSTFVAAQLYEGLVRVDGSYNVLPAVAIRWRLTDRGRRYTFRLRDGLRWSDGTPLTAADFAYAWRRNLRLEPPAPLANLLYVIENARDYAERRIDDPGAVGVSALDDYTLEVRLEQPVAYLPPLLAQPVAYPLPDPAGQTGVVPAQAGVPRVGNGPFRLESWEQGVGLVLTRNPFYRGRFAGNVTRVVCSAVRDYGAALDRYGAGEFDVVNLINADAGSIARARAAYGRELIFVPRPSTLYLTFRTDRPPLNDVRVRQALVHAVDRDALVSEVSEGQYLPAHGGFVPPGMPGHTPGIGLPTDAERSRVLLREAGYGRGSVFPPVSWLYSGGAAGEPVVPFLQRSWRESLGLNLTATGVPWPELNRRLTQDPPDLWLIGWSADLPDPDGFLRATYHGTEGVYARASGWRHAHYDALVDEAAHLADAAQRMALYVQADRILVREATVIMPLCYAQGRLLVKPWVDVPRVPPASLSLADVVLRLEPS